MLTEQPFTPKGKPISLANFWRFTRADLEKAVRDGARSVKPFLLAKLK